MLVRHIVSVSGADVATTRPDATIADAAKLLKERNVGALVITTVDGRLAGILSERDLVRGLPDHGADLLALKVKDRMTAEVTTCSPDDRVDAIMKLMTDGRFRHLPVVEEGKLVGIVSIGDVVKSRLEELESETTTLREYIAGSA
ncbi:MAG: CBS domain-containing protein [Kiloniellales bacterium]|nr:CBS domain-containing protein [Kiloniellales bacterium]MDJ0968526.1 CBS domain-containing protein [Kiloniellales bacterium]MDJ0980456.1 CBS domain-containing protein [Kiloniellales bacterium]